MYMDVWSIYVYICMYICDILNGMLDPNRKLRSIDTIDERGEVFTYIYFICICIVYIYI
jgi:hypothetical protein